MEETQSLLYKIKPLSDRLPSVKRPEGHVHFRTKMMWVVVVLVLYFVMTNVYLYGLDRENVLDLFAQYRTIMAGASGSLLQLGIGPIVTASIIMQLFVGAKIIKLDLTKREDKACYQSVLKLLVIVMIVFEAIPQVAGYLTPSEGLTSAIGGLGGRLILILQLFVGSWHTDNRLVAATPVVYILALAPLALEGGFTLTHSRWIVEVPCGVAAIGALGGG